jgi:hypothetical protein
MEHQVAEGLPLVDQVEDAAVVANVGKYLAQPGLARRLLLGSFAQLVERAGIDRILDDGIARASISPTSLPRSPRQAPCDALPVFR